MGHIFAGLSDSLLYKSNETQGKHSVKCDDGLKTKS